MKKLFALSLVVCVAIVALQAAAGKPPEGIFVLTVHDGTRSRVSDSYTEYADALAASKKLRSTTPGSNTWAIVSSSTLRFPQHGKGIALTLWPILHAQVEDPNAIVLPPDQRIGEFVSPDFDASQAATKAGGTLTLSDADVHDATVKITLWLEQPGAGFVGDVLGGMTFQGSPQFPVGFQPSMSADLTGLSPLPFRLRVTTCLRAVNAPACTPDLRNVGVAVEVK